MDPDQCLHPSCLRPEDLAPEISPEGSGVDGTFSRICRQGTTGRDRAPWRWLPSPLKRARARIPGGRQTDGPWRDHGMGAWDLGRTCTARCRSGQCQSAPTRWGTPPHDFAAECDPDSAPALDAIGRRTGHCLSSGLDIRVRNVPGLPSGTILWNQGADTATGSTSLDSPALCLLYPRPMTCV